MQALHKVLLSFDFANVIDPIKSIFFFQLYPTVADIINFTSLSNFYFSN